MVCVYITGTYEGYAMEYIAVVEGKTGKKVRIGGKTAGSQPEAEVAAMGMALKYVYENSLDAVVYTSFANSVKWANGEWNAGSKRVKDYVRYVKRVREQVQLDLISGIPDDKLRLLHSLMEKGGLGSPAGFRVLVRDAKGKILADFNERNIKDASGKTLVDFNEKDFYGILADAIYFADWYEKEGKNEKSYYYGCSVERYNVPSKIGRD